MALIAEDDYFNTRLHEINDEMQKLLDRTARQRDDLLRPRYVSVPGDGTMSSAASPDAAAAAPALPASMASLGPLERAFVEQEMRKLCREAMTHWMATDFPKLVNQVVEREVEKHLADVLRTTDKVLDSQRANAEAVAAVQKEWKDAHRQLSEAARQAELQQRQMESTLRAETERYISGWRTDMDLMKDTVSSVERNAQLLERREEKRVAELAKQHLGIVHDKLSAVHEEVDSWKTELYALLRREVGAWRGQRVELEAQVARCDGAQRTHAEAIAHQTASLTNLLEGDVELRAEMRRCRRDVNRLEMLVQCAGVSTADAAKTERGGREGATSASPAVPSTALMQELFATKDRVGFLAGRLEAMERRLHHVDQLLFQTQQQQQQRSPGSRRGPAMPTSHDPGSHVWDSPLAARGAHTMSWDGYPSASMPYSGAHKLPRTSFDANTSADFMVSEPVRDVHPSRESSAALAAARQHPQTADVDRPMPTHVAGVNGGGNGGARRGLSDLGGGGGRGAAEARPVPQRRPPPVVLPASSGSDVEDARGPATPEQVPRSQQQHGSRFTSPLLAGSRHSSVRPASRGGTSASHSPRGMEAAAAGESPPALPGSVSVTPHDSYISASASRRDSPVPSQSAASRGQYTPIPGSDTESEISNQKLSRIALD